MWELVRPLRNAYISLLPRRMPCNSHLWWEECSRNFLEPESIRITTAGIDWSWRRHQTTPRSRSCDLLLTRFYWSRSHSWASILNNISSNHFRYHAGGKPLEKIHWGWSSIWINFWKREERSRWQRIVSRSEYVDYIRALANRVSSKNGRDWKKVTKRHTFQWNW